MNVTTDEATRQLITSMAAEIQTTAAKAFELYITGLRIEAGLDLLAVIIGAISAGIAAKKAFEWAEEHEPDYNHSTFNSLFYGFMVAIIAGLLAGLVGFAISNLLQTIIIPEYTAMQEVIRAVR